MIDEVTGIMVPERSAQALARAVLRILDAPRWRERVAVEGPKFVSQKFGHERMVRETIAIYRDCELGAESPQAGALIDRDPEIAAE